MNKIRFKMITSNGSFLDLNVKVIGNNIKTSVYDKRDDFGFPIVNFTVSQEPQCARFSRVLTCPPIV